MKHWRWRWRYVFLAALSLGLAGLALVDGDDDGGRDAVVTGDDTDLAKLRIASVSSADVAPGDAVVVRVTGMDADGPPVTALVSKQAAEVVSRKDDTLVVRVPADIEQGKAGLRVMQGERKSKALDLNVKTPRARKLIRSLIGGLALLLLGIRFLSRGLRGLAGRRLRQLLGRLTLGPARAVGLGALVGGATQLSTSSSALAVSLLEARLIPAVGALALVTGAQLGAAVSTALIPTALAQEGSLFVALGVLWLMLAADRRGEAVGDVILGCGLLFFGLHLLRVGFQPLVSAPAVLPYLRHLQDASVTGFLVCVLAGALLAALLQGPAALFGLVGGLMQATGVLDLPHALALLAGTGLGAAISTAAIAWPSGLASRRLAVAHLLLGLLATLIMLAAIRPVGALADALVPGAPHELAYGKKVLLPNAGAHLALAFLILQVLATGIVAGLVPWTSRLAARLWPGAEAARGTRARVAVGVREIFAGDRAALDESHALCLTGEREHATRGEHRLKAARAAVEELLGEADEDQGVLVTTLHLQRSLEELLRLAELCVERDVALAGDERAHLQALHDLVAEGLRALEDGDAIDLEAARAREIRLNAREAAVRRTLRSAGTGEASLRLTELLNAYENVGNNVYRVAESLVGPGLDAL